MKRGLLTWLLLPSLSVQATWRSDKRQEARDEKWGTGRLRRILDVSPSRAEASIPTRRQTVSQYLPVLYYLPLISSCIR